MAAGRTRPGSVFGALVLIALGAVFLYGNLKPDFSPWPLLARWWPALIVLWGLAKLVNYLALRGTPEGAAAGRITAGDVFGIILLVLLGSFLTHLINAAWWRGPGLILGDEEISVGCLVGREYDFTDEVTESLETPAPLRLSNSRGYLKLSAGTEDRLRVRARKKVCATSRSEAERLARQLRPVLEQTGAGFSFVWQVEGAQSRLVRTDLDVEVPAPTPLRLANRRGDVEVQNLSADVRLELKDGSALLENVGGDVTLELDDGSVRLRNIAGAARVSGDGREAAFTDVEGGVTLEGGFYGPIKFIRVGGPVRFSSRATTLRVPRVDGEISFVSGTLRLRDIPGDVTLDTRDKEVEIESVTGGIHVENRNGPVSIRYRTPPARNLRVETRRGDIEIYLPAESGFEVTARARDGEIESEFSAPGLTLQRERGRETLSGTHGTPRATLQLSTTYGTIRLRHALAGAPSD